MISIIIIIMCNGYDVSFLLGVSTILKSKTHYEKSIDYGQLHLEVRM